MIIAQERLGACRFGSVCAGHPGPDWNPSLSASGPAQRGAVTESFVQAVSDRSHVQ